MRIVRSTETRRTATPAAVMTTLASPTLGDAPFPLWRVEAAPGTAGPLHRVDAPQIWTLTAGTVTVEEGAVEGDTVEGGAAETGGEATELAAGDTLVIPAGQDRRFTPGPAGFTAIVAGPAGMRAAVPAAPDQLVDLAWAA
ncbi:hypothetical protein SAMN05216298_1673 [Glycomyces sambucus]|uniref:Cupin domain-containing protein n=1 Tax=Glycomyces sambucus TaxID=380244 RepID=A0A1G9FAL7_9ACTN|nr:hypothetical protein [Glycomyces sambucus]SDK85385.1 hypothetical protein SAMN05216298_1673 [Glycomyces sambucus]